MTERSRAIGRALLGWHARNGRHDLPWRRDRGAYRVTVSEFMLQQTQVDRVIPIFGAFVARWPTLTDLAQARRGDVVRAWRGLGYNSRAVRLHELARIVGDEFGGRLPRNREQLARLPGVGPYTLRAIRAFAFNANEVALDTNVRRIVHRVRFGLEWPPKVAVAELDAAAGEMLPRGRGFDWNSALMDLGAAICTARAPQCSICPIRDHCVAAPVDIAALAALSRHHARPRGPQERLPFEQTTRYLRGRVVEVLRDLGPEHAISLLDLKRRLPLAAQARGAAELATIVARLARDGVVEITPTGARLKA